MLRLGAGVLEIKAALIRGQCDWAKKRSKNSCRCIFIKQVLEAGRRQNAVSCFGNDSEKNTRAIPVGSRARLNQKQNWSPN